MINSAVIVFELLVLGLAAPAMETESAQIKTAEQSEHLAGQQRSNASAIEAALSGSSVSEAGKLTWHAWIEPTFPKQIPPGYKFQNGLGYYKLHNLPVDFYNAKATCEREGAYLAIINSEEEAIFVASLLDEMKLKASLNLIFIGIHDLLGQGNFITILGQPLNQTGYAVWYGGQPDDVNGACIIMDAGGKFHDTKCGTKMLYACELSQ